MFLLKKYGFFIQTIAYLVTYKSSSISKYLQMQQNNPIDHMKFLYRNLKKAYNSQNVGQKQPFRWKFLRDAKTYLPVEKRTLILISIH